MDADKKELSRKLNEKIILSICDLHKYDPELADGFLGMLINIVNFEKKLLEIGEK